HGPGAELEVREIDDAVEALFHPPHTPQPPVRAERLDQRQRPEEVAAPQAIGDHPNGIHDRLLRRTHKLTSPRPRGIVNSEIASWPRVWCSVWFCGDPTFSDSILTVRGTPTFQDPSICREPEGGPRRQEGATRTRLTNPIVAQGLDAIGYLIKPSTGIVLLKNLAPCGS